MDIVDLGGGPSRDRGHIRTPARSIRGPRLTDRDVVIMCWITRHGVVTLEHIALRFFFRPDRKAVGTWAAYKWLDRARLLGLILVDRPAYSRALVVRVSRKGAHIADVGIRPAPLVLTQLAHTLAVVELVEVLREWYPNSQVITERELWAQHYRDIHAGRRQIDTGRIADGALRGRLPGTPDDLGRDTIAIELDVSPKDRRRIERIIQAYAYENYACVWWFVNPSRVELVRKIVVSRNAQNRILVYGWTPRQGSTPPAKDELSAAPPATSSPTDAAPPSEVPAPVKPAARPPVLLNRDVERLTAPLRAVPTTCRAVRGPWRPSREAGSSTHQETLTASRAAKNAEAATGPHLQ